MTGPRKMPTPKAVVEHWEPWLIYVGKFDEPGELLSELDGSTGVCFACGWRRSLERAHIVARLHGGSDNVDNIHLLCGHCHHESEFKEGNDYWYWFLRQNCYTSVIKMATTHRPQLIAELATYRPDVLAAWLNPRSYSSQAAEQR